MEFVGNVQKMLRNHFEWALYEKSQSEETLKTEAINRIKYILHLFQNLKESDYHLLEGYFDDFNHYNLGQIASDYSRINEDDIAGIKAYLQSNDNAESQEMRRNMVQYTYPLKQAQSIYADECKRIYSEIFGLY